MSLFPLFPNYQVGLKLSEVVDISLSIFPCLCVFYVGLMLSDIVDISVSWFLTRRPPFLLPGDAS